MKSRVSSLLEQALGLPVEAQRKVACLLGAGVADAASRPLHWEYDLNALNKAIKSNPSAPEFWPESRSPFYSLPTGQNSCYFDESFAVMTSLANKGEYDFEDICAEFRQQLGPGSQYNMAAREEYMELRRRGRVQGPIKGKWLAGSMVHFFNNSASNKQGPHGDSHVKETDGFCCALPVVVKYVGEPGLHDKVKQVATTQSTWPTAVRHAHVASKIIEAFLEARPDPIQHVKDQIRYEYPEIYEEFNLIENEASTPHTEAVGYVFGRPCYNPGSFMGAIHAVETSESFKDAVRKTIKAGGCNCSRSFFIGAMLGAKYGLEGVPRDWVEQTTEAERIIETAIKMVQ